MIWPWPRRRLLSIDERAWSALCGQMPMLASIPAADAHSLRRRMADFLSSVTINGAHDLPVSDSMRLQVAVQACIPVIRLGLQAYDAFSEVVLYPGEFKVRRRIDLPDGTVCEFDDVLWGEAQHGGPVVLSWSGTMPGPEPSGRTDTNLVIHEFAHKLDLADGIADGCPPMSPGQRTPWLDTLLQCFDEFNTMMDRVEAAIPADIDPESAQADPWYALLPLDPYAATDPAEFFAVSTEKFFVDPLRLQAEFPALIDQYRRYFGIDPLLWCSFNG